MAKDIMGPDFAMMGMLVAVMLPGERVVSVENALAGFANEGLLTVAGASSWIHVIDWIRTYWRVKCNPIP